MTHVKHQEQAAMAADALRAALIAVEDCGADPMLTDIVIRLTHDRYRLCLAFGLPPEQAFQADMLARGERDNDCRWCGRSGCHSEFCKGFEINDPARSEHGGQEGDRD